MSLCQVSGCRELAVMRCDNGFALCRAHRQHDHGKTLGGNVSHPVFRGITVSGDYFQRVTA